MATIDRRTGMIFAGDLGSELEGALDQCRAENGGRLVGEATLEKKKAATIFEYSS